MLQLKADICSFKMVCNTCIIPSKKLTSLTLPKIFPRKYGLKNDKFLINNIFTDKICYFFYLKLIFDIYGFHRKNKKNTTNEKIIILILLKILYIFRFFTLELYLWRLIKIDWPREKKSIFFFHLRYHYNEKWRETPFTKNSHRHPSRQWIIRKVNYVHLYINTH